MVAGASAGGPNSASLDSGGRSYGNSLSSLISVTVPSRPASRIAAMLRAAACPPPMTATGRSRRIMRFSGHRVCCEGGRIRMHEEPDELRDVLVRIETPDRIEDLRGGIMAEDRVHALVELRFQTVGCHRLQRMARVGLCTALDDRSVRVGDFDARDKAAVGAAAEIRIDLDLDLGVQELLARRILDTLGVEAFELDLALQQRRGDDIGQGVIGGFT